MLLFIPEEYHRLLLIQSPQAVITSSGYMEIVGLRFQDMQKLAHNKYFARLTAHMVDTVPTPRYLN